MSVVDEGTARLCESLRERFDAKVDRSRGEDGCWHWTGSVTRRYGNIRIASKAFAGKQTERAHRVAWMLERGPIPEGGHVLHRCDNPICVNPAHLFIGDDSSNVADKVAKGRHPSGERAPGAKLTERDVRLILGALSLGESARSIADRFGVKPGAVYAIRAGRTWKSLQSVRARVLPEGA